MNDVFIGVLLTCLAIGLILFSNKQTERKVDRAYRKGFEDGSNTVLERKFLRVVDENEKD